MGTRPQNSDRGSLPPASARRHVIGRGVLGGLLLGTIWLLGFPWLLDAVLLPLLLVVLRGVSLPRLVLLMVSSWMALGLGEVGWRILARRGQAPGPYYRPEDQYARKNGFEPGIDLVFPMPHGDLVPMEPTMRQRLAEARNVRFITDDRGYRNDENFSDQTVLLVGDSFVLGSGVSQEFLLANVLERDWGFRAYSIGVPKSPEWLLQRADALLGNSPVGGSVRVLLFIFEGNDFSTLSGLRQREAAIVPLPYDQFKLRWIQQLGFHTGNRLFNLTRQWLSRGPLPEEGFVEVRSLAGKDVGFLGHYIDMALATDPVFDCSSDSQRDARRLAGVFFIPTKYRVYHAWAEMRRDRVLPDPPPALLTLRRHFTPLGIPVVDLTPGLRHAAATGLERGEFVYWRDDSHWNPNGVLAAAKAVAAFLETTPAPAPVVPSSKIEPRR